MVASFVARNPDVWLHLAAGKRLVSGEYKPGSDPFSYSAADRAWVNHSLLYDLATYLLYDGDKGALLVIVKALVFALAFGLLIAIRQPGYSVLPWAAVAAVAILAAAPRMLLSPLVGSVFFEALTLFLLFRLPHRPGSWRFPILIGVTFWVWAQVDAWFILGPITLVLVLVSELIQKQYLKQPTPAAEMVPPSEPLGSLPDVPTLAKALGIGVVACMLNPHHVRVWELPFELYGSSVSGGDARLRYQFFLSPVNKFYYSSFQFGRNLNGLAYAVLFVGGSVLIGLGAVRLRIAHVVLWVVFAGLSLYRTFGIPFLAVVAVPIVASQLNALSVRVSLKDWHDLLTRFWLLGSAALRIVLIALLLTACVLAWPGWLQPESANPAFNKRVAWAIEPDADLVRVAKQLQDWRESGRLTEETHGLIVSVELSNYCAWYAPLEKVFVNGNYLHHRAQLPDYVGVRRYFNFFTPGQSDSVLATDLPGAVLERTGARYLVCAANQIEPAKMHNFPALIPIENLWVDTDHWAPWFLDGRCSITAWRPSSAQTWGAFEALKLNPVELAFGPRVEPLTTGQVRPVPVPEGWEEEFLRGTNMASPDADDAFVWSRYNTHFLALNQRRIAEYSAYFGRFSNPAPTGESFHGWTVRHFFPGRLQTTAAEHAVPFIALRAARRSIAADPDHPDGYYALFQALKDRNLPLEDGERISSQVTALRQCLVRLPPPEKIRTSNYLTSGFDVARSLAALYFGDPQHESGKLGLPLDLPAFQVLFRNQFGMNEGVRVIAFKPDRGQQVMTLREAQQYQVLSPPCLRATDLARDMLVLAVQYGTVELGGASNEELETIKSTLKVIDKELEDRTKEYERDKLGLGSRNVAVQVRMALKNSLVKEALSLLTDKGTDLGKEFKQAIFEIVQFRIALELLTGRLEDAAEDLKEAPAIAESAPLPQGVPENAAPQIRQFRLSALNPPNYLKYFLEGDYRHAGDLTEGEMSQLGESDPPLAPALKTLDPAPFKKVSPRIYDVVVPFAGSNPFASLFRTLGGGSIIEGYASRQQQLLNRRTQLSKLYFHRGLLALMEGDISGARRRFIQSRQDGVPEWNVPDQRHPLAERYLRLIEIAEKQSKP
jgi:hypothetical protein